MKINIEFIKLLLTAILCVFFISGCIEDKPHEDERPARKNNLWAEVALTDINGKVFFLSCPVRTGGFLSGHNDGCYLKVNE